MSRLFRALILCLAVLPAVWGTCPGWITGTCCCAKSAGTAPKACCPLCAERERQSGRKAPCTHCPCQMARDGSAPAPDSVEAPVADLSASSALVVLVDVGPVLVATANVAAVDPRPPGWPRDAAPNRVGIVVLVV